MRTRIDGFDQAQRNYDAMEAPTFGEPREYPCVGCGEDVGESILLDRYVAAHTCPTCSRPLCAQCADKDEEISERCAECCAKEKKHG